MHTTIIIKLKAFGPEGEHVVCRAHGRQTVARERFWQENSLIPGRLGGDAINFLRYKPRKTQQRSSDVNAGRSWYPNPCTLVKAKWACKLRAHFALVSEPHQRFAKRVFEQIIASRDRVQSRTLYVHMCAGGCDYTDFWRYYRTGTRNWTKMFERRMCDSSCFLL